MLLKIKGLFNDKKHQLKKYNNLKFVGSNMSSKYIKQKWAVLKEEIEESKSLVGDSDDTCKKLNKQT